MSRYDHKIETSLEGIEHLSKEKKEEKEITEKEKIPCEGESVLWSDPWAGLIRKGMPKKERTGT